VSARTEITIRYDAVRSAASLFTIGSTTALPNRTLSCTGAQTGTASGRQGRSREAGAR
jgi:hypothetical protein